MGRRHAEVFLNLLRGEGREPNPTRCSPIRRAFCASNRIRKAYATGFGAAGSNATAVWAAELGVNLQSSTLKSDETGEPPRPAGRPDPGLPRRVERGWASARASRVGQPQHLCAHRRSRSRLLRPRRRGQGSGWLFDEKTRAIFGRSYAAQPDALVDRLRRDEAIAEADTLLLTVPNQLGSPRMRMSSRRS